MNLPGIFQVSAFVTSWTWSPWHFPFSPLISSHRLLDMMLASRLLAAVTALRVSFDDDYTVLHTS